MGRDNSSGRNPGRGGGNGKGGRFFNAKKNKGNNSANKTKEREMRFAPQTAGKANYHTYSTVKEHIENYIQKTYKEGFMIVATSLAEMKEPDLESDKPVLKQSTATDEDQKAFENKMNETMYQEEVKQFLETKKTVNREMTKAYALIFGNYCTTAMQQRIEQHPDFETFKNDPIKLLDVLKTLVSDPVRAHYPYASMVDALLNFVHCRQQDEEDINDYYKRFKHNRDVLKNYLGSKVLDYFVEHLKGYKDGSFTVQSDMKKEACDRLYAYLLIRNADRRKYGSIMKHLQSQYSLGNDQYPVDLSTALDVLSNHPLDSEYREWKKKQKAQRNNNNDKPDRFEPGSETSLAQKDVWCYCCGKPGHKALESECDKYTSDRSKWVKNRGGQSNHQQTAATTPNNSANNGNDNESVVSEVSNVSSTNRSRRSGRNVEWSNFQRRKVRFGGFKTTPKPKIDLTEIVAKQSNGDNDLKDVILLDTGSSIAATFMNPELVRDIRVSKNPIAMATNAGTKPMNLEANVEGYGKAYYDSEQMANIFGFAKMVDKHRITYDSDIEDAFNVHLKNGSVVKFARTDDDLYAFKPGDNYRRMIAESKRMTPEETNFLVSTVKENEKGYTKRQLEDAKRARKLYHIVGCPTVENFKHLLKTNFISNCPVTPEHVRVAEAIYGPDMGVLKGKTTRRKPPRVQEDTIEIPMELKLRHTGLTWCIDPSEKRIMP